MLKVYIPENRDPGNTDVFFITENGFEASVILVSAIHPLFDFFVVKVGGLDTFGAKVLGKKYILLKFKIFLPSAFGEAVCRRPKKTFLEP